MSTLAKGSGVVGRSETHAIDRLELAIEQTKMQTALERILVRGDEQISAVEARNQPHDCWLPKNRVSASPDGQAFVVGFAAPNSNYVFINQQFNATIVAPKADVNADLSSAHASLVGSVFAKSLTFHQGSVLGWVPFAGNWTPTCSSGNTNCN